MIPSLSSCSTAQDIILAARYIQLPVVVGDLGARVMTRKCLLDRAA
jgi:hypothetical protein